MNHRIRTSHTKPQAKDIELLMDLTLAEVCYIMAVLKKVQKCKQDEIRRDRIKMKSNARMAE